jgi:hypothetical protein
MKPFNIFIWILRLLAAVIMIQTLYFKFTGHPQSVKLFTTLGMEPWGRTTVYGAALGMGLMSGAIFFHLTKLGIKFDGDYVLFLYAVIAFVSCGLLVLFYRNQLLSLIRKK